MTRRTSVHPLFVFSQSKLDGANKQPTLFISIKATSSSAPPWRAKRRQQVPFNPRKSSAAEMGTPLRLSTSRSSSKMAVWKA